MRASILVCLIGCGGGGNGDKIDAPLDIDAPDIDAPGIDAARPPASHLVFLSFEGQVLSPGTDDAVTNHWVQIPDANPRSLTQWAPVADHMGRVQQVTAEVVNVLAPFDVDVVTTRPTTGPYHMIVYTHLQSQDVGLAADLLFTSKSDCGTNASQVAVVFQASETANFPHIAALAAVASLGGFFGVENSAQAGDCMCRDNNAVLFTCSLTAKCTVGGAGTVRALNSICGTSGGTFDETAEFLANIGVHP